MPAGDGAPRTSVAADAVKPRIDTVPQSTAEPPDRIEAPVRDLLIRRIPITEVVLEQLLREHGIEEVVTFRTDRYVAWLEALALRLRDIPTHPWTSVQPEIAKGREELLAVLRNHRPPLVCNSRLQTARDLGIASGAFLSSGAALAVPVQGGYSRAAIAQHGWHQLLRAPRLWARLARVQWRIDLHTNARLIDSFTVTAWHNMYAIVDRVMRRERCIDATVATAWYLDPAVAKVSPHLAYLRELPPAAHALFVDLPPTEADRAFALQRSTHRREAEATGRYRPHATFMYWPGSRRE